MFWLVPWEAQGGTIVRVLWITIIVYSWSTNIVLQSCLVEFQVLFSTCAFLGFTHLPGLPLQHSLLIWKKNKILLEMQQKTDVLSSDFKEKLFQQRASKLKAPYPPSFCIRHPWDFCVLLYNCGCGSTPSWLNLCLDFRNHRQQFLCLWTGEKSRDT